MAERRFHTSIVNICILCKLLPILRSSNPVLVGAGKNGPTVLAIWNYHPYRWIDIERDSLNLLPIIPGAVLNDFQMEMARYQGIKIISQEEWNRLYAERE